MGKLAIITLPKGNKPFEEQWFTEEEANHHRVWRLNNGPYHIVTADKTSHLFSKTIPYRVTNTDMLRIGRLLIQQEMLLRVSFIDEEEVRDGYVSQEWDTELATLNSLRSIAWKNNAVDTDKEAVYQALYSLVEEAEQDIDYFVIHVPGIPHVEITITSTGSYTYLNNDFIKESQLIELIERIMTVLIKIPQIAHSIPLRVSKKVQHPLKHQHAVLTKLLSKAGKEVQQDLGLPEEEWSLIIKDFEMYSLQYETDDVHEHKATHIREHIANKHKYMK